MGGGREPSAAPSRTVNPPSTPSPARRQQLLRLALHSALILFFEMLLIRWIGTEVRVFAYLQNGVLVAVFLGLGLGCRNAREPVRLLPALLVLLPIGFIVADPFDASLGEMITQGLAAFGDSGVWHLQGAGSTGAAYVVRLLLFVCALSLTVVLLAACTYAV